MRVVREYDWCRGSKVGIVVSLTRAFRELCGISGGRCVFIVFGWWRCGC